MDRAGYFGITSDNSTSLIKFDSEVFRHQLENSFNTQTEYWLAKARYSDGTDCARLSRSYRAQPLSYNSRKAQNTADIAINHKLFISSFSLGVLTKNPEYNVLSLLQPLNNTIDD